MKKLVFIFFSLSAFCFLSCGPRNVNLNGVGRYPKPLIEPLPLKAGVYYTNEFQKAETTVEHGNFTIPLGKASVVLFDYILSCVFKEATPIYHIPKGNEKIENIDVIIEPSNHGYQFGHYVRGLTTVYYVKIVYAVTFHSLNNKQMDPWVIYGKGYVDVGLKIGTLGPIIREATQIAMRDVAAQFIAGFCNQEDIQKHFYKECNR